MPCVISTAHVAELQAHRRATRTTLTIGAAVTYTQALPASRHALPGVRRAGAPHRLAPDPQPRHARRQSRPTPRRSATRSRACMALDASVTLAARARHAHAAGRGVHHRLSQDRAAAGRGDRRDPHPAAAPRAGGSSPTSSPSASTRTSRPWWRRSVSRSTATSCATSAPPIGGMAARAQRATHLEAALTGRAWSDACAAEIDAAVARDFTPMGDHRGSAAYRLRAAANLVHRLRLETTSRVPTRVEALMNTPLARIRGGVHTAVRHDSAVGHVTGRALYIDDVPNAAGTLQAALVLSPHAHARIRRIDFTPCARGAGRRRRDRRVRHSGQERHRADPQRRAAAGRRTGRIRGPAGRRHRGRDARRRRARAAKLVDVEYEPLPAILSIEDAIAREAYVAPPQSIVRGDAAARAGGRAASPHRRIALRRPGSFLSRRPDRARHAGRGRRACIVLRSTQHPTEVQHVRRASARPAVQRA